VGWARSCHLRPFALATTPTASDPNEGKAAARSPVTADDDRGRWVLFIPDEARLSRLVDLPEADDLGAAVDAVVKAGETANSELRDVLTKGDSAPCLHDVAARGLTM